VVRIGELAASGAAASVFDVQVELDQPGGGVGKAGQAVPAGVAAPPGEHGVGLVQAHQLRPVGQGGDHFRGEVLVAVLDPPGQLGAGGGTGQEPGHGEKVAVGQVQGARGQFVDESVGELLLAGVVRADRGGADLAGAAGGQRDRPGLRMTPTGGGGETRRHRLGVGQVEGGAVERGQLEPELVPAGHRCPGLGGGGPEQGLEHLLVHPGPGLRQRRGGGHRAVRDRRRHGGVDPG
jgi:hypothetical protein